MNIFLEIAATKSRPWICKTILVGLHAYKYYRFEIGRTVLILVFPIPLNVEKINSHFHPDFQEEPKSYYKVEKSASEE